MTYHSPASQHDIATNKAVRAGAIFMDQRPDLTFIFNVNSDGILLRLDPEKQTPSIKELATVMNDAAGGMEAYSGSKAFDRLRSLAHTQGRDVTWTAQKSPATDGQPEKIQPVIIIGPVVR